MQLRSRVTVSGEPGAGKTTLVAALLAAAPAGHCVRACEEIRELAVPITHGSYYEVRPPALDGTGEIRLRDLVKFVLAMRPDRIVVGEVRGAEAFELSRAVNAGCGFLCTVHANSASEAPRRAGERRADGGRERDRTDRAQGVLGVARRRRAPRPRRRRCANDGESLRRQVVEIAAVVPALRDDFTVEPLFVRDAIDAPLRWTGALPASLATRLERVQGDGPLHDVLAGAGRGRMTLLAALAIGVCCALLAGAPRRAAGRVPTLAATPRRRGPSPQLWLAPGRDPGDAQAVRDGLGCRRGGRVRGDLLR